MDTEDKLGAIHTWTFDFKIISRSRGSKKYGRIRLRNQGNITDDIMWYHHEYEIVHAAYHIVSKYVWDTVCGIEIDKL